jgi:hypothetical protein
MVLNLSCRNLREQVPVVEKYLINKIKTKLGLKGQIISEERRPLRIKAIGVKLEGVENCIPKGGESRKSQSTNLSTRPSQSVMRDQANWIE